MAALSGQKNIAMLRVWPLQHRVVLLSPQSSRHHQGHVVMPLTVEQVQLSNELDLCVVAIQHMARTFIIHMVAAIKVLSQLIGGCLGFR